MEEKRRARERHSCSDAFFKKNNKPLLSKLIPTEPISEVSNACTYFGGTILENNSCQVCYYDNSLSEMSSSPIFLMLSNHLYNMTFKCAWKVKKN